ncbi:MAG TPA: fimbria/pilus outer membrane usher protein, partial [Ramlibacter sp.]|nr:fimbria/pilus outer membrane usher protein [Ramlibacter sp.]
MRLTAARSACLAVAVSLALAPAPLRAQAAPAAPARPAAQEGSEELIAVVRANGVDRGEFTLLRDADGDFLVPEAELARLKVKPVEAATRAAGGEVYYSLRALGATDLNLDAEQLILSVSFPVEAYELTQLDLAGRRASPPLVPAPPSAVLNYRASAQQSNGGELRLRLSTELSIRVGPVVLRQEYRYSDAAARRVVRGATQVIRDDRASATRWTAGDQVVRGDAFGSAFLGFGLSYARLFTMTPELIRQPTASARVSALGPSTVEVAVDGSPVYRTTVGPGPIAVENLYWYGGARSVRITVTDASGRRQVVEQPYLFTESVLAQGLHEFSYFVGRRARFAADETREYPEPAWQAFHRYGLTDDVTVQAGGEGSDAFATMGIGATARHQRWGVFGLDVLVSTTDGSGRGAALAGRYSYLTPTITANLSHRLQSAEFTTFADVIGATRLRRETRMGLSAPVGIAGTLSAEAARARDSNGPRWTAAARFSTALSRSTTIQAEVTRSRTPMAHDWGVNVFLRHELDTLHWTGATARATGEYRTLDLEAGRQLVTGEGFNYRLGTSTSWRRGQEPSAFGTATGAWNLRPVRLELNAVSQLRGGTSTALEAAVAGSVVAIDGYWGLARPVTDSFALARLGVPREGVEVLLNNLPQGRTGPDGTLLIPQVAAFGRQEIALNEKDLPIDYSLRTPRIVIAPDYRSGVVVDFAGRALRAFTGVAWQASEGNREPIASPAWTLQGSQGRIALETTR